MITHVAIKLKNGSILKEPAPLRHADILLRLQPDEYAGRTEGFLDDKNNFMDRDEAWKYADEHGQILPDPDRSYSGTLYSEDIW